MKSTKDQPSDNSLLAEVERVELTSRAGGYKTRNLVKKAEEMLAYSTTAQK